MTEKEKWLLLACKTNDRDEKERYRVVKELRSLGVEQASKDVSDINTMSFELQLRVAVILE